MHVQSDILLLADVFENFWNMCLDFEIKKLGEYHNLHVQSDTLLLADVFDNFQSMCYEIYELDSAKFLSAPGLAWRAAVKNTKEN